MELPGENFHSTPDRCCLNPTPASIYPFGFLAAIYSLYIYCLSYSYYSKAAMQTLSHSQLPRLILWNQVPDNNRLYPQLKSPRSFSPIFSSETGSLNTYLPII